MPPGSAKSTYASVLFPPWLMQRWKGTSVLAASHTTELAEKWGRRVRNLVGEHALPLGISVAADNQAAGRWALTNGGEYYAAGVGTGIAGFRAGLGLIDDPIRSRQDADSELIRDRIWDWYINDFRTRLIPGAPEILIQCMTGDTPVLMETGQEKPLRDIRPGDRVATYENGRVSVSTVRNWINNGPDRVFEIRMKSGIVVKANARHPFLVEDGGELKWQRTATLKKGSAILRVIGASGRDSHAQRLTASARPDVRGCATRITINSAGQKAFGRLPLILGRVAKRICGIAMELAYRNTKRFLSSRAAFVRFASKATQNQVPQSIGVNCAWITATPLERSVDFCATIATTSSGTGVRQRSLSRLLDTFEIARDTVLAVVDGGVEDVFDVQIDRTENFIANGLVSHNTRWHEDDLAGRALQHDDWRIVSLPAEAEYDDPLGRSIGQFLWTDGDYGYGAQLGELKAKTPARTWSALYQQRPAPEEGDYFKADWLRPYETAPALETLRVYGGSDYAVTADGGDFTVHALVGVDPEGRMYLLDLWRRQASSDHWVEAFCDLVLKWKPMSWAEEQGQIKSGVGPFLERRMRERKAYVVREQFPTRGDKSVRAQSIRGRMALEGLYVPINASWFADFRSELLSFPAGKHDDQVDAIGLVGQLLDRMISGRVPDAPAKRNNVSGYRSAQSTAAAADWQTF